MVSSCGLCFNQEGKLVVCDEHNCCLQVFDAEARFIKTLGTTKAQKGLLCSPIGIMMDFHGRSIEDRTLLDKDKRPAVNIMFKYGPLLSVPSSIGLKGQKNVFCCSSISAETDNSYLARNFGSGSFETCGHE